MVALSKFDSGSASFVEKYSYSAFGETTVTLNGNTGNPYRFTGREYESETGLYYYRARFYKPEIGRFLQTDPIGYYDSANLYQYCGNNPLAFVDPYGLCKSSNWLDWAQGGLDAIGVVDPFGIADGVNTLIYLARGNYVDAGISAMAMIPFIGDFAKVGKYGAKASKWAHNADLVQEIAVRAERKIGGTGGIAGTYKHKYAKNLLDRYQRRFGDRGLLVESSWKNGEEVIYGTKGSVRIDVLDRVAGVAYDYKFTIKPNSLKPSQVQKIKTHGFEIQSVVEINP